MDHFFFHIHAPATFTQKDCLFVLQQEWDIFLSDVDKILADDYSDTVQLGQTGPIHDNLVDVRTNESTSLESYLGDQSLVLVLLRHFA